MSLDLKGSSDGRKDSAHKPVTSNSENGLNNNNNVQQKSGELVIILDGLTIDMTSIPVASPPVAVSVVPSAYDPMLAAAVVANGEGPGAGTILAGAATAQGSNYLIDFWEITN